MNSQIARSPFRLLSIRGKLLGIIALATVLPLAAGFIAVIVSDRRALERELVETAVLVTRVTAENSVSAVAFDDHRAGAQTLQKLASVPNIRWAALFTPEGRLFAEYAARGQAVPANANVPGGTRLLSGNELRVSEAVAYGGDHYGTLVLSTSTAALQAKLRTHVLLLLSLLIGCVAAAIALAMRLQNFVTEPILELAALARDVSENHDYSVRVKKRSEDEVGVLASGFNEMLLQIERRQRERDEADQRNREKSQFLANMSHELRTPLNAIIGFSDVLRDRLAARLEAKEAKFLDNINSSGQHLLGIVNDILDLSKIEAGKMEIAPERFAVRTAVESVCSLMRGVSALRRITFELDCDDRIPLIEADPVKVKQILYNLLSNAVKFSPERSTVTIRTRPAGARAVRISVIDQGIGIDPRDHDRIFQEFQQVDTTVSRQFEGTGLGLTLVKKFVEMHGGAIDLESALGRGSTFTVTLPLRFRGEGVADAAEPAPAPAGAPLVLVIEDEAEPYHAIDRLLTAASYATRHARTGEEGIELARALRPAAITLDVVLPGIDGFEVLKALKSDPATKSIPVVIVSVLDNRELGFAFGAQEYLVKPIEEHAFVETLARIALPRRDTRLLVIDDDAAVHELLDTSLRPHGYELLHAYGATEGVARASAESPSLVILEMNGIQVAATLKSNPKTAAVPILVIADKDADKVALKGTINAMVERGQLSGNAIAAVIRELTEQPRA